MSSSTGKCRKLYELFTALSKTVFSTPHTSVTTLRRRYQSARKQKLPNQEGLQEWERRSSSSFRADASFRRARAANTPETNHTNDLPRTKVKNEALRKETSYGSGFCARLQGPVNFEAEALCISPRAKPTAGTFHRS